MLDDRSRILVHLGTEPGSKAYRLLDPRTRKITVSRDIVFDETKGWNWSCNNTGKEINESFKFVLENFGSQEIQEEEDRTEAEQTEHNNEEQDRTEPDEDVIDRTDLDDDETETGRETRQERSYENSPIQNTVQPTLRRTQR